MDHLNNMTVFLFCLYCTNNRHHAQSTCRLGQCLSQDLETGFLKLAVVNFLVVNFLFKEGINFTFYSEQLVCQIKDTECSLNPGSHVIFKCRKGEMLYKARQAAHSSGVPVN